MKDTVLITGTSGRIGESIAESLASAGYSVKGVDKVPGRLTTDLCDIGDLDRMRKLMIDVRAVVHSAAYHAPHVGIIPDKEFLRVNVEATKSLAELAIELGVRRFIFTSTTALYGYASQMKEQAAWIDETTVPKPKTIYHFTKIQGEGILEQLARTSQLRVTVIRMSRCFAEPADLMAVYRLHRGVDRRDVAMAHRLALETEGLPPFDAFVVSGKSPFHQEDCIDLHKNPDQVLKNRCPDLLAMLEAMGSRQRSSIDRVYDSSKAIRVLGWLPLYGFHEVFNQLRSSSPEVLPLRSTTGAENTWQAE